MTKQDFNGFQDSFHVYCEWCEKSEEKMSWGEWWDSLEATA